MTTTAIARAATAIRTIKRRTLGRSRGMAVALGGMDSLNRLGRSGRRRSGSRQQRRQLDAQVEADPDDAEEPPQAVIPGPLGVPSPDDRQREPGGQDRDHHVFSEIVAE